MSPEYILLTDKGMPWYKEHQNRHVSKMQLQNIVYVLLPVLFLMILHNTVCPSVPFTIKDEGENSRERLPVLLGMDHFFNNPQSTMLLTSDAVRISRVPCLSRRAAVVLQCEPISAWYLFSMLLGWEKHFQRIQHEGDSHRHALRASQGRPGACSCCLVFRNPG